MRTPAFDRRGLTLVEVMVSVALFGVLSVGLMTAFATHAKRAMQATNEARLSEDLVGFSDALESYLVNTTQFIACGCGNGCVYMDAGGAACTANNAAPGTCAPDCRASPGNCSNLPGVTNTLIRFEYEDANNPGVSTGANNNCLLGNVAQLTDTPDGLILRGCKRRMDLIYTPPVAAGAGGQTTPGTLSLQWESPATGLPFNPPRIAAQLNGVYAVQCGQLPANPGAAVLAPSPDNFRIRVLLKTRSSNFPAAPGAPDFEGWFPTEQGFWLGTHRTVVSEANFRNLDVQGVQFGKAVSYQGCTPDGATAPPDGNCCSGYVNTTTNVCLPMANCLLSGTPAPPNFAACCSHRIMNGTCL